MKIWFETIPKEEIYIKNHLKILLEREERYLYEFLMILSRICVLHQGNFLKNGPQKSVFEKSLSNNELPDLSLKKIYITRYALSDLDH